MIVTPFGDTQAHGAFGKSVILERRRGIVYAKSFRIPKNPRSILQKIQRQKFTAAIAGWQSLTPLEQDYFNQLAYGKTYTGFNLYVSKQLLETPPSTTPLVLEKIEDLHITTTRAVPPDWWGYDFIVYSPWSILADTKDPDNIYTFFNIADPPRFITVTVTEAVGPINVHASDTILMTYDSGKNLYIFLPAMVEETILYIADDGSTYYDAGMTNLAQAAP